MTSTSIRLDLHASPVFGEIVSRPTRFTLLVDFGRGREEVYLRNPGALSTVLLPGREILCVPNPKEERKTSLDGLAVRIEDFYATIDSHLANTIFERAVGDGLIFPGHTISAREKNLSGYGRIDFIMESPRGDRLYVEVKSCTHVEESIAMFPDRPTERGRRQLESLIRFMKAGATCVVVFVVQRPDASAFRPFHEVDGKFSDLLRQAVETGLRTCAVATRFIPPQTIRLEGEVPVRL